jgi:CheY-like chemotaxis protein
MRVILIVDDDPLIRKLITTTLQDVAGFRLREAADGQGPSRRRSRSARRSSSSTTTCRASTAWRRAAGCARTP